MKDEDTIWLLVAGIYEKVRDEQLRRGVLISRQEFVTMAMPVFLQPVHLAQLMFAGILPPYPTYAEMSRSLDRVNGRRR